MNKNIAQRFLENRFTYLLISVVSLFLIAPFVEGAMFFNVEILAVLFLVVLMATLWSLNLRPALFGVGAFVALLVFVVDALNPQAITDTRLGMSLVITFTYSLFILFAIMVLILYVFREEKVTMDTVRGGISIYFLTGILWAFIYQTLTIVEPESFSLHGVGLSDLLYFSFVTMTTLGYGDMTPATHLAKNLSILEAILGQLFLAIFVARLVGLYVVNKSSK